MMRHRFTTACLAASLLMSAVFAQVKRGSNEGTFNIPASNVMGNGNIVIGAAFAGGYAGTGLRTDPGAFLAVGITDIMQLSGKTAFTNFKTLGGTEAHLQITLPGNDRLRFFGAAVSGDLYLSTVTDTVRGAAVAGRPEYHAFIRPSVVIDCDWIAKFKALPLKSYLMFGMADDPDLLFRYSQISLRMGIELKLSRNSFSADFGSGWYKELRSERLDFPGDGSFVQQRFWIEPAVRYRLFDRMSLVGAARILLLQRVKRQRPLDPTYVRLSTALEVPLLFRETNAEAIRTMIFVERKKAAAPDVIDSTIARGTTLETGLNPEIMKLDIDISDSESENDVLARRREIQRKMDEIEQLLEGLK